MKKFLALVLALVMTMSLVTVSAGAEGFSDESSIDYLEAVEVMKALKVIDGYADGSFNPDGTLTRGAAAKIICNMILGPTTAADLAATTAPFKDVPANHTFAGYIAYCAAEGIVGGYADGTFQPAATLTSYAFMKMLLGALGYDAVKEGYNAPNWGINVGKQALGIGLHKGLEGTFVGTKAVTRQEACLYAFNTLKATMVTYPNDSTIIAGNVQISTNTKATPDTLVAGYPSRYGSSKANTVEFSEKYFGNLINTTGDDAMGRPTTIWSIKANEIGEYAKAPAETLVVAVKDKDLKYFMESSAYANYVVSDRFDTNTDLWYNGAKTDYASAPNLSAGAYADLERGDVIEIYLDADGDKVTDVVVANYDYAKVDTVATNMTATEKDNGAAYRVKLVDVDGNSMGTHYDDYDDTSKNVLVGFDAATYTKDTVLAVAKNGGKINDSYVVEPITGTVSAVKEGADGYVTVDGVKSEFAGTPVGVSSSFSFARSYDVFTTEEGYVFAIKGLTAADLSDIYYVTSIYAVNEAGETKYYAQRVSMEGEVETVKVEAGAVTQLIAADGNTAIAVGTNINDTISGASSKGFAGLYTFNDKAHAAVGTSAAKQKAGNDVLTIVKMANDADVSVDYVGSASADSTSTTTIASDDVSVTLTTAGKKYVNAETKWLSIAKLGSGIDVKTAVGGMKISSSNSNGYYVITTVKDTKTALAIIAVNASADIAASASKQDVVYLAGTSSHRVGANTYSATLYSMEDGSAIAATITSENGMNEQGFYTFELKDGVYRLIDDVPALPDDTYDATEDGTGPVENLVVTSVYDKSNVTVLSGAVGSVILDDSALVGVTVIDNRLAATKEADEYKQDIVSVSDMKEALKVATNLVVDVYYDDGVTFVAVDSVNSSTPVAIVADANNDSTLLADNKFTVNGTTITVEEAIDYNSTENTKKIAGLTMQEWAMPAGTTDIIAVRFDAPAGIANGDTVTITSPNGAVNNYTWSSLRDGAEYFYYVLGLKDTSDKEVTIKWGNLGSITYTYEIAGL